MKRMLASAMSTLLLLSACTISPAQEAAMETEAEISETVTALEEEIPEDAIEVSSAEDLMAIADDLSAYYILTADIDLGGERIEPIGKFVQMGQEGEEAETPSKEAAFTGTFNGNGHVISNYTVASEDGICTGLFGCIANAVVENLTVENASAEGTVMVSDVVGYAYQSTVNDIVLKGGSVKAYASELSEEGMYGGIVGAGMASMLINCTAEASIEIPDNTANAGIVGGGLEMTSLLNCSGSGSVNAGENCYGLGGVSGCAFGAEEISACSASDVTITALDGAFWIGGITGYAGGFEDETAGIPVTVVSDCTVSQVELNVPEDAEGIGDFVGAGFFNEQVAQAYGAPYDQPTVYVIENCSVDEGSDQPDPDNTKTEDESAEAAALLEAVRGTYTALFPVITDPQYDQLWLDPCIEAMGEEAAPQAAEMLKWACNGTIYGGEAIEVFGDGSEGAQFDCLFINGVDQITFDGTTISGTMDGNEVFRHEYTYTGKLSLSGMMEGYLYETADEDAGEFKYFYMMPDTPATTYHLEFRYGSDVDALSQYNEGAYAYWLAAGFPVDANADMIKNVITLFCEENLAEMQMEEAA